MDKDDRSSGGVPGGGLMVVVLLAVGALFISKPPLESSRPAISEPHLERLEAAQDIETRLWQDPFGAVAKARERTSKQSDGKSDQDHHSEQRFADELQRQARLGGDAGVFVVAVMLFGGPYAEQIESRRRMRYAVLAGLRARGLVPTDNEHVGYFYPHRGDGPVHGQPDTVPFESFESDRLSACGGCRLVVLWLDSSPFRDRPLSKLRELAARSNPAGPSAEDLRVRWRVLGPASSDGLRALIDESASKDFEAGGLKQFDFRFFSSGATAPDDALLPDKAGTTVSDYLETRGVTLVRTIGTDDHLARGLVDELKRRGMRAEPSNKESDPRCPDNDNPKELSKGLPSSIAIVTEADTLYGRTLHRQFAYAAKKDTELLETEREGFCPTRWHYFRGIDGRLPGEAAPQTSDGRTRKESKPDSIEAIGRRGAYSERPEGTSQFDYVRRLASRIRADDQKLRQRYGPKEGGIRAVGVLGSDTYDKLLVLQALQPEIPHAVFFTTDLDARLFHPREQDWARNLIVASSFGLTLTDGLQREVAPFRDSYQTAAYFATLLLIADAGAAAKDPNAGPRWKQKAINAWFEKPRIFEISRSTAFDFSPKRAKGAPRCTRQALEDCKDIHPGGPGLWPELPFTALMLIFALLAAAMWVPALAFSRNGRRRLRRFIAGGGSSESGRLLRRGVLLIAFAALAILPALLLANHWPGIAIWMTQAGDGKPLSVIDGISPWPTYWIRLATLFLCLYFVAHAWACLRTNVDRIAREFHLGPTRRRLEAALDAKEQQLTWWQRLASVFEVRFYRESARSANVKPTTMTPQSENFWMHYVVQNRFWARFLRTVCCVALMFALGSLIIQSLGDPPLPPQRGELTGWLHMPSIIPTVLMAQFLIFFVADATVLCVLFMRGLRLHAANWAKPTLAAFHARLGVPVQYLDDWIDLEWVARRTRCVAALIYYPFIVLSLMILARSSFFDDWYASAGLNAVVALSFGIVVACAFALRRSAEASRRQALSRVAMPSCESRASVKVGRW